MTDIQLNYLNYLWTKEKQTQELALNERSVSEVERHNRAVEAQAERELAVSWYQAETARLNYNVNMKNAETNAYNAQTNRLNYEVNAYNAQTNRLNYSVNAMNAQANMMNAQSNARNVEINARNAEINAMNAQTRLLEYQTSNRALSLEETKYWEWGREAAKASVYKTYAETQYNKDRGEYYGASARDIMAKTRSSYWNVATAYTEAQTADMRAKQQADYWKSQSDLARSQASMNDVKKTGEGLSIFQKTWGFVKEVVNDVVGTSTAVPQ